MRVFRLTSLLPLALLGTLGAAPAAVASTCQGAPGASALQQYCEAIPDGSGALRTPGKATRRTATPAPRTQSVLSATTVRALDDAGREGAAVQRLVETSTGAAADTEPAADGAPAAPAATGPGGAADRSSDPIAAVRAAVDVGPTASPALVWGLIGITGLGAAAALARRRHPSDTARPDDQ